MANERPKMRRSSTRNPIMLYCSQPTQTKDDSEPEKSEFPPCKEGNGTPPSRYSPVALLPRPQQLTISNEEEEPPQSRHRQPNTGLGQTNILNTVNAIAPVQPTKVVPYIPYA